MDRNVTAVYRNYSVAELVRKELEALGISRNNIHLIPDTETPLDTSGYRDNTSWSDQLHDLHLPDDDTRTYQQCVRRGDYVVSANVDDTHLGRAQDVMRRPEAEAHDLDLRSEEFRNDPVIAHTDTTRTVDSRYIGQRETTHETPYVRAYRRGVPLGGI